MRRSAAGSASSRRPRAMPAASSRRRSPMCRARARRAALVRRAPRRHDRDRRRADGGARPGQRNAGGLLSATIHLSGKPSAPQAEGQIDLLRGWAYGAFIGDIHPVIAPVLIGKHPGIQITGDALAGQLGISATIGTEAPYPVDIALSGPPRRARSVHRPVEEARRRRAGAGVGIGHRLGAHRARQPRRRSPRRGSRSTELAGDRQPSQPRRPAHAAAVLARAAGAGPLRDVAARDERRRRARVPQRRGAERPRALPRAARHAGRPRLDRRPGERSRHGAVGARHARSRAARAAARGPGRRRSTARSSSPAAIGGHVRRSRRTRSSLDVDKVDRAAPARRRLGAAGPRPTRRRGAPAPDQARERQRSASTASSFNVKDERRDEQGELHVAGTIGLDGFTPATLGRLDRRQDRRQDAARRSRRTRSRRRAASRRSTATLSLSGKGPLPLVDGTITFDPDDRGAHAPRRSRSSRAACGASSRCSRGSVDIDDRARDGNHRTYTLDVDDNPLTASIDGEGKLENIRGRRRAHATASSTTRDVSLDAENIPFRIPGTLDLILVRDERRTSSCRRADSRVAARAATSRSSTASYRATSISPRRSSPRRRRPRPRSRSGTSTRRSATPTSTSTLEVRRFAVKNNIAPTIELAGPRILIAARRAIRACRARSASQRGEFKIPGTRAKFTRHDRLDRLRREREGEQPDARHHERGARLPRPLGPAAHDHAARSPARSRAAVGPARRRPATTSRRRSSLLVARPQPRAAAPLARRSVARQRSDARRSVDEPVQRLRRSDRQGPRRRLGARACSATRSTQAHRPRRAALRDRLRLGRRPRREEGAREHRASSATPSRRSAATRQRCAATAATRPPARQVITDDRGQLQGG